MTIRPRFDGRFATSLVVALAAMLAFSQSFAQSDTDERPLHEQPYLGLSVRHYPDTDKCIVSWIFPGPLGGQGFTAEKEIQRGDYVMAVDDVEVHTPDQFTAEIKKHQPGDEITLTVHSTEGNTSASVPTPGDGDIVRLLAITLDSRADWVGPVSAHVDESERFVADEVVSAANGAQKTPLEQFINERIDSEGLREPVDKLHAYFSETLHKNYGANMLSRVAYGFERPTRLAELHGEITDPLVEVPGDPVRVLREIAANLDLESIAEFDDLQVDAWTWSEPKAALEELAEQQVLALSHLDRAFAEFSDEEMAELRATYPELVEFVADNFYITSHPDVKRMVRALNASLRTNPESLLRAMAEFAPLFAQQGAAPDGAFDPAPLPNPLFDAVDGDVVAVLRGMDGWLIVGGMGDNTYDMSRIDIVIDIGGNDTYRYTSNDRPRAQVIVDYAGNDTYRADDESIAGPASALMGVSLTVDHAGNDRYEGGARSCAAGVMGHALLIDHAGADTYTGTRWSCGAAFYGSGVIIDRGNNNDVYTTHHFSQAIGGPRGFGAIIEENGRDLYRNNGPVTSVYGTDAVYAGISQGVGFGVRQYDSGGIGVLCDLGGHDRYEAGEFSQGGAYYWALGILYDRNGRDLYYGNRYTQAFAAHQALGILVDDAGDDTYWGMTAATQSGSWDICATLLLDRAGDDTYQADGLSQGGASMQAIAWLVDLAGTDRYNAPGGATQGQSGGNSYHYDSSGCFSFSLLLDAGGADDLYSTDRANNTVKTTGSLNEDEEENSNLHGLFIDTSESIEVDE